MLVMKFGGTSVGTPESIENVLSIIEKSKTDRPFVVVSALSGVTDMLIAAAKQAESGNVQPAQLIARHDEMCAALGLDASIITKDLLELEKTLGAVATLRSLTPQLYAVIVSFGERLSSKIIAAAAIKKGLNAKAYNAYDLGMLTNTFHKEADVVPETFELIPTHVKEIPEEIIPIVTGFIAKDKEGAITTLGRGGSDYTAALFGSALNADRIQIWTDVDGVMTTDPRIVTAAEAIPELSFREASELAYFGAKVLHPKTIVPAIEKNIPVYILNTLNPAAPGTKIVSDAMQRTVITAIAYKKDLTAITITQPSMLFAHGFAADVFNIFAQEKVAVDMIFTSEVSISVTVDARHDLNATLNKLNALGSVSTRTDLASISVIGAGLKYTPGLSGILYGALGSHDINVEMTSQGASDYTVGVVVDKKDCDEAVRCLHQAFFESPLQKTIKNDAREAVTGDIDGT